jgi:hypothetical protein
MISFSAPEYNPIGALIIHREPEDLFSAQRRATATATLEFMYQLIRAEARRDMQEFLLNIGTGG